MSRLSKGVVQSLLLFPVVFYMFFGISKVQTHTYIFYILNKKLVCFIIKLCHSLENESENSEKITINGGKR